MVKVLFFGALMSSSLFAFHHMIPSPWDLIYVVIGCLMMPDARQSLRKKWLYPSSLGLFWSKNVSKSMGSKGFGVKVDFCRDEEDDLVHSSRKQAHLSKALTNVE